MLRILLLAVALACFGSGCLIEKDLGDRGRMPAVDAGLPDGALAECPPPPTCTPDPSDDPDGGCVPPPAPLPGDPCDGEDRDRCWDGVIYCAGGAYHCDDSVSDFPEICNGMDDDCNPGTPDGSDEPTLGAPCAGGDGDACADGHIVCIDGALRCEDESGVSPDLCDGFDNDCDPATADGSGDPRVGTGCDGPDPDTCAGGHYVCDLGALRCEDTGGPSPEICDGVNNDCNPATADGADEPTLGDPCDGDDADLCAEGVVVCREGGLFCEEAAEDALDLCDGIDNDCNPATPDGADEPEVGRLCDSAADADFCLEGRTRCVGGALVCDDPGDEQCHPRRLIGGGYTDTDTCTIDSAGFAQCWRPDAAPSPGFPDAVEIAVCRLGVGSPVLACVLNAAGEAVLLDDPPIPFPGVTDGVQLVAFGDTYMVLRRGGEVLCWGDNGSGQCGTGDTAPIPTPTPIPGIDDAVQIDIAVDHACVVRASGEVWCWGRNRYGALGLGAPIDDEVIYPPTRLLTSFEVAEVRVNGFVTCLISRDARLYGLGFNRLGMLGDGTGQPRDVPTRTLGLEQVERLYLPGGRSSQVFAITSDGLAYGWGGENQWGERGDGNSDNHQLTPTRVLEISDVAELVGGFRSSYARTRSEHYFRWGLREGGSVDVVPRRVYGIR